MGAQVVDGNFRGNMKVKNVELHRKWRNEVIDIDQPHAGEVKVKMAFAKLPPLLMEHNRSGYFAQDPAILEVLSRVAS